MKHYIIQFITYILVWMKDVLTGQFHLALYYLMLNTVFNWYGTTVLTNFSTNFLAFKAVDKPYYNQLNINIFKDYKNVHE